MNKTIFKIPKMDCPAEESLIRIKLEGLPEIKNLEFDLKGRLLTVLHNSEPDRIHSLLGELKLGSILMETGFAKVNTLSEKTDQSRMLLTVLGINFLFFVIEIITGFASNSMGLVADSLDMLADSFVYGISLFAVGGSLIKKKRIALTAGYFQIVLAVIGFVEVVKRFLGFEKLPEFSTMIIVSVMALIANGFCLYLLQKSKSKEAHMQASMIFTSNDVIINVGVIAAGILVNLTGSNKPDLIIGALVFIVVIGGAMKILRLSK